MEENKPDGVEPIETNRAARRPGRRPIVEASRTTARQTQQSNQHESKEENRELAKDIGEELSAPIEHLDDSIEKFASVLTEIKTIGISQMVALEQMIGIQSKQLAMQEETAKLLALRAQSEDPNRPVVLPNGKTHTPGDSGQGGSNIFFAGGILGGIGDMLGSVLSSYMFRTLGAAGVVALLAPPMADFLGNVTESALKSSGFSDGLASSMKGAVDNAALGFMIGSIISGKIGFILGSASFLASFSDEIASAFNISEKDILFSIGNQTFSNGEVIKGVLGAIGGGISLFMVSPAFRKILTKVVATTISKAIAGAGAAAVSAAAIIAAETAVSGGAAAGSAAVAGEVGAAARTASSGMLKGIAKGAIGGVAGVTGLLLAIFGEDIKKFMEDSLKINGKVADLTVDTVGGALTGASLGSIFGPGGMLIGAIVGGLFGIGSTLIDWGNETTAAVKAAVEAELANGLSPEDIAKKIAKGEKLVTQAPDGSITAFDTSDPKIQTRAIEELAKKGTYLDLLDKNGNYSEDIISAQGNRYMTGAMTPEEEEDYRKKLDELGAILIRQANKLGSEGKFDDPKYNELMEILETHILPNLSMLGDSDPSKIEPGTQSSGQQIKNPLFQPMSFNPNDIISDGRQSTMAERISNMSTQASISISSPTVVNSPTNISNGGSSSNVSYTTIITASNDLDKPLFA